MHGRIGRIRSWMVVAVVALALLTAAAPGSPGHNSVVRPGGPTIDDVQPGPWPF